MLIDIIEIEKDYLPSKKLKLDFTKTNENGSFIGNELLIFGRNGTGKTTISKSIYEGIRKDDNSIIFCKDSKKLDQSIINEKNVFVYNESFIDEKVRFTSNNNLEAIVMLGDQGDYQDKLDLLNRRLESVEKKYGKYSGKGNTFNKDKELNKVKKDLRGDERWAGRESKIKLGKVNPDVNNSVIDNIVRYRNNDSITYLHTELKKASDKLVNDDDKEHITKVSDKNLYNEYNYRSINETLKKTLDVDNASTDLKKRIEHIFNEYGKENLESSSSYLDTTETYCKTCFQNIDNNYKKTLKNEIYEVLNNEYIKLFENEIDKKKVLLRNDIKTVEYNKAISSHVIDKLNDSITNVNEINKVVLGLLDIKKQNLNEILVVPEEEIIKAYNNLYTESILFNNTIDEYNDKFDKIDEVKATYTMLNYKIAYNEIKNIYNDYNNNLKLHRFNCHMTEKAESIIDELKNRIELLRSKHAHTQIALEDINKSLAIIFYDKDRLKLINENGFYRVLVRGRKIPLNNLSTGEKNIIGLSYFFSLLHVGKSIDEKYKDSLLIVLDDPISSFDFENKIGIYNFLRTELELILVNNRESQLLITTHDAEVYTSLEKLLSDIKVNNKPLIKNKINRKLLTNEGAIGTKKRLDNIYSQQFEEIYNFAVGDNQDEMENYIGNTMRRVFEAYSTFNYRCGIDELRTNPDILRKLENKNEREFFGRFMVRLLLNNESHGQYQSQFYTDINVFEFLSKEEKILCAKLLIFYLYRLDSLHVEIHLRRVCKNIETRIQEWEKLIP